MVPTRVMINEEESVAPHRTEIQPVVIFERGDGWTLGAPKDLIEAARRTWRGSWVVRWDQMADGR